MLDSFSPKRPDQPEFVKKLLRDDALKTAAQEITQAENLVVFYGSEGTNLAASQSLANAATNLLIATGHIGRANNGLVAVWDKGNAQGAWDQRIGPSAELANQMKEAVVLYIAGADPSSDDPQLATAVDGAQFVIVQELAMTKTALAADVVFPTQAFTERDGSYTSGERRVQRFYPAVPALEGARPDFAITAQLAAALGLDLEQTSAALVFKKLAARTESYKDLDFGKLAEIQDQWPIVGRADVYYGGTTYDNKQGLGVQLSNGAERGQSPALSFEVPREHAFAGGLTAYPVSKLYDRGNTVMPSKLLSGRLGSPEVVLSPEDAEALKLEMGKPGKLKLDGAQYAVTVWVDNSLSKGSALIPRSLGIPIHGPAPIQVEA
jgi:NADH-quinone oxidoreductase subunit G